MTRMEPFDLDTAIAEIAVKHKVLLDAKDPVLVTVTLNDLMFGRYARFLNEASEEQQRRLAAALAENVELSKQTAGRIITDAAGYVAGEVRQTVDDAMAKARSTIERDLAAAQQDSRASAKAQQAATNAAIVAGVAAVIALAAMVIAIVK